MRSDHGVRRPVAARRIARKRVRHNLDTELAFPEKDPVALQ